MYTPQTLATPTCIAEALKTPADMYVRVLRHLKGVYAHLQPVTGAIYPAVRGKPCSDSKRGAKQFCWINICDHVVFLRGRNEIGATVEYEEVTEDEYREYIATR